MREKSKNRGSVGRVTCQMNLSVPVVVTDGVYELLEKTLWE